MLAFHPSLQLMRGAAPFLNSLPIPSPQADPSNSMVTLNVGGKTYATTSHTLLAAPNSYFWELLVPGPQVCGVFACVLIDYCFIVRVFMQTADSDVSFGLVNIKHANG